MSNRIPTPPHQTFDHSLKLLENDLANLIGKEFISLVESAEALLEDGLPQPDWDILKMQSLYVRQITECAINHYFDVCRLTVNRFADAAVKSGNHKRLDEARRKSLSASRKLYQEILSKVEQARRAPTRSSARAAFSSMRFEFEV